MRSAYPAQKLMDAARRFDRSWCRYAVLEAARTDLAMKSQVGADGEELLIDLILKLANRPPRRALHNDQERRRGGCSASGRPSW